MSVSNITTASALDQYAVLAEASVIGLTISEAEASAGFIGLVNVTEIDSMRQHDALSRKYVASRGVTDESLVISVETINATSPIMTICVVSVIGETVRWLAGEGINTAGTFVTAKGKTIDKKGAGYGVTTTTTASRLAEVLADLVWSATDATYGAEVRDPLAWRFEVTTWQHDARFKNGGNVTGAEKHPYA